ncbi:MAG: hypothetical protein JXA18_16765 [Chitinispirillaceae bacterium]|nr:hypothetical protein [Chitinispirillaceae bacterium]
MKTILIGIHGLRNKPSKYILTDWWKKSIIEGFRVVNLPVPRFSIEIAYWAQYMHTRPQDAAIADQRDPRYLWEPYLSGSFFGPREPHTFKEKIKSDIHQELLKLIAGETGFMNIDAISNAILHRMFIELDVYYHGTLRDENGVPHPARDLIRGELIRLLVKHRNKNICLLAHSMGTIIAYDVLLHGEPAVPVHTLITFGCPLGFPVIRKQIQRELGLGTKEEVKLPTPETIRKRWMNFSDLEDVTCLNYNLRTHYHPNEAGVRPYDRIVYNNYECGGVKNPHKAYGYLRTLDVTQALNTFLVLENAGLRQRIMWLFRQPMV